MLPPDLANDDARRLLRCFRQLPSSDRAALLAFAEFLTSRATDPPTDRALDALPGRVPSREPVPEPRPPQESVVAAIKRLRRVYPMLDSATLLTETSTLMTGHIMHGRAAAEVIDELEALFADRYAQTLNETLNPPESRPEPR